jgi:hypothetical protein
MDILVHTAEPLVPETKLVEVEITIGKLKRNKYPRTDLIPAELIIAGSRILCPEAQKFTLFMWNKEQFTQQWKESIIVQNRKDDKNDCNNYPGISLSSTAYKILSNIFLTSLTPYVNEFTGDHHCGFRRNKSTTDQIFYIRQRVDKKIGV